MPRKMTRREIKKKVAAKRVATQMTPTLRRAIKKSGIQVELTLSTYDLGMHSTDPKAKVSEHARPSFAESLVPFSQIAEFLVKAGVPVGTKIKFLATIQENP